jgi:hypothetical protein
MLGYAVARPEKAREMKEVVFILENESRPDDGETQLCNKLALRLER